ncbi:MAG: antirestriction protein ArdA [Clostridia bacterium]|nr:antirestriction protein ArdA [Clostridia bacterium]
MANQYMGRRGYAGAVLQLPAGKAEIADALICAHVPSEEEIILKWYEDWPQFLDNVLDVCGEKTLEEVNLLAYKLSQMDEYQLDTYEGAIKLRQEEGNLIDIKELINICYNLNSFVFHPDILNDKMLGELCLMGELLDVIQDASDEVIDMLDEEKVGRELRKSDKGVFTAKGYLFLVSETWTEIYDGVHLPEQPDIHEGVISLRLNSLNRNPEQDTGTWLDLPAGEAEIEQTLERLRVPSLESCIIAEARSIVPLFHYQIASDMDINELNILAKRIQAFPDKETLIKYKAALEFEQSNDLELALNVASNLNCYELDSSIISLECYAEQIFQKAGIDTDDPAFTYFDFRSYGERHMQKNGFAMTPYGVISRNGQTFVWESARTESEMVIQ